MRRLMPWNLSSPMSFFSTKDQGEIMNSFTQDLRLVDKELPVALSSASLGELMWHAGLDVLVSQVFAGIEANFATSLINSFVSCDGECSHRDSGNDLHRHCDTIPRIGLLARMSHLLANILPGSTPRPQLCVANLQPCHRDHARVPHYPLVWLAGLFLQQVPVSPRRKPETVLYHVCSPAIAAGGSGFVRGSPCHHRLFSYRGLQKCS